MQLLTPGLGLIIWTLLAFLVVFFVLKKFAWPQIISGLKKREEAIAESLATADRIKEEMAQFKSEHEALLAKAREERGHILKEARDIKEQIINDAREKAKSEANKIISNAQESIENQKMAAIIDVKNEVGKMVIEVAEKLLRKELSNKAEQEKHIRELVDEVKFN